jgi:hypothetical protein
VKKIELRNRIRTAFPHVQARLHRPAEGQATATHRWQIKIDGANSSHEIHEINRWAHAANVLPHVELNA